MSNATAGTTKVGGRVGIVGTGHRARVSRDAWRGRRVMADESQLYTKAISDRPTAELVALCDLNEERMKYHNVMLKELGRPEAVCYHAVSGRTDLLPR